MVQASPADQRSYPTNERRPCAELGARPGADVVRFDPRAKHEKVLEQC